MRKGRDRGNGEKNGEEKRKGLMRIVATMSLPAVDCPNADCWSAARSCQKLLGWGWFLSDLTIFIHCVRFQVWGADKCWGTHLRVRSF